MEAFTAEALKLVFTIAAAYGGVKASLNGAHAKIKDTKAAVDEIRMDVKGLVTSVQHNHTRLAILEDRNIRIDKEAQ